MVGGSIVVCLVMFFFSSRRRHTRWNCDWSSDVCSSDLALIGKSQEEAAGQFESLLHEMSEVQYRDLMGRIEKGAGEAGAQAAAEVRNASETLVHQLSEKVDIAAARLQEQHEQSRSGFESSMKDSL